MDAAFLKLWAVLEIVTATTKAEYDTTIRRTRFLYRDRDLVTQTLEHLRYRRNEAVHRGEQQADSQALLYQLKRHVEKVLGFHLFIRPQFKSFDDAAQFLDLSGDTAALRSTLARVRRGLRFMRP